jgi:alkane 1-monooxygenase
MPLYAYTLVLVLPLLAMAGLFLGGAWSWATPAITWLLLPALELCGPGARRNASPEAEQARRDNPWFDRLLMVAALEHAALLAAVILRAGDLAPWDLAGAVVSLGSGSGVLAINVAHELGHRPGRWNARLAQVLLGTTLYAHFWIEHNRGHHAKVATPGDPASAARGDTVFAAWARSIPGSFRSAYALDPARVRVGLAAEAALVAAVGAVGGWTGLGAFLAAAAGGILLLETVNYVEHYGLRRERLPSGRYEPVAPRHSWTSDRAVSRALLFDLSRHADHHAFPARPYAVLRHHADAPELPTGYAGMVMLALCPPAFFAVMDPHLDRELRRARAAA